MRPRPEGICTQLYRCKKCGHETYQVPPTPKYTPTVEHPCPKTGNQESLAAVK